jgi:hypothetical protein
MATFYQDEQKIGRFACLCNKKRIENEPVRNGLYHYVSLEPEAEVTPTGRAFGGATL